MRIHNNHRNSSIVMPLDHFINLHNMNCRIKHDEERCAGKGECPFCDFENQRAFQGEDGARRLEFYRPTSPDRPGWENPEAPPA